jgi:hypothetical protein
MPVKGRWWAWGKKHKIGEYLASNKMEMAIIKFSRLSLGTCHKGHIWWEYWLLTGFSSMEKC